MKNVPRPTDEEKQAAFTVCDLSDYINNWQRRKKKEPGNAQRTVSVLRSQLNYRITLICQKLGGGFLRFLTVEAAGPQM